jgi:hypothetical protein
MKKLSLLAVALLLVSACGGSSPSAASTPTAAPSAPAPLVFPMKGVGATNQGVTGTVTIQPRADGGGFTVVVDLKGMIPNSVHVYHIHKGTCANNGPIAIPLPNPLQADASGHAMATNIISSPYQGNGFYANVHTGPDLSSAANAAPCACGDLSDTAI